LDTTTTPAHVSAILNAAWMVRHYARGGRTSIGKAHREQAILKLGLTVREAFSRSDDFEALLAAVVAGLKPQDYEPPF